MIQNDQHFIYTFGSGIKILVMAGNLKELRSILRQYRWLCDSSKIPGEFQVIGIYCYVADSTFLKSLTPVLILPKREAYFLYDIIITDGKNKLKCFLAPSLGHLVQRHLLKVGDFLEINSVKMCYLEGEFGNRHIVTYVLLENIDIIQRIFLHLPPLDRLRFLDSSNPRELECRPLVTGRKYYLDVWCTMQPFGPAWSDASAFNFDEDAPLPLSFISLMELSADWKRLPRPYPTLLVKVISRGRLYHYGHSGNDRPYAFVAFLMVADSTGIASLKLFGKSNLGLYEHSSPGTILLLEKYLVSERVREIPLPLLHGGLITLPLAEVEIIVAEFGRVKIVPRDAHSLSQEIALLPSIEHAFVQRSSLELVAADAKVDVVGLVTYVSSYHRFGYKLNNIGCLIYVEMIDSTSYVPFKLILFCNHLKYSLDYIHPGVVLVCTQMKVIHLEATLVPDRPSSVYLKSSTYTEMHTKHRSDSAYTRHAAVIQVANIIRDSLQEVDFLRSNVLRIGGFVAITPAYRDLNSFQEHEQPMKPQKMTPGAYWKTALETVNYRQRIRHVLGGFIVQVEYVDIGTVDSQDAAYGWSYQHNVRSRRTLFLDIRIANRIGNLEPLRVGDDIKYIFPQQYNAVHEDDLKSSKELPATTAEYWKAHAGKPVPGLPVHTDGYYVVTIVSLHFEALLQCILIPEPSAKPHPTFMEIMSGTRTPLPFRHISSFMGEPSRYTWPEVRRAQRTASHVSEKTFVFLVDFYCVEPNLTYAIMERGYICPPDEIDLAQQADLDLEQ